ncbi:MAG: hypothetical protein OXH79_20645 [Boseongicola sp.]|nr:hypothetical protein [Boseongicola sp.]
MSRQQFEELFPDDGACARHLAEPRWGDGFACTACRGTKGWDSAVDKIRDGTITRFLSDPATAELVERKDRQRSKEKAVN